MHTAQPPDELNAREVASLHGERVEHLPFGRHSESDKVFDCSFECAFECSPVYSCRSGEIHLEHNVAERRRSVFNKAGDDCEHGRGEAMAVQIEVQPQNECP